MKDIFKKETSRTVLISTEGTLFLTVVVEKYAKKLMNMGK